MFVSKKKHNELLQKYKKQEFDKGIKMGYEKGKKDGYSSGLHEGLTTDRKGIILTSNGTYLFEDRNTSTTITMDNFLN